MSNGTDVGAWKTVFVISAIYLAILGVVWAFIPAQYIEMTQDPGAPQNPGWLRWSGGIFIGLACGALLASKEPAKQAPVLLLSTLAYLLSGLSLLYSVLSGEYQGDAAMIWAPIIINAVLVVLFVWLWSKYKEVI